jgi:uncharacterized protein YigE (DUF2233 family)
VKQFFLIIILLIGIAILFVRWLLAPLRTSPDLFIPSEHSPSPTPVIKTVTINNEPMAYAFVQATASRIQLIPNFTDSVSSDDLIQKHACIAGINGSFYDTDNRPLGLFLSNGTTLRARSNSTLMNGFFNITANNIATISYDAPEEGSRIALQSGPMLISDAYIARLSIRNDEHARRMVAALSADEEIIFLTLFHPESTFDGPLLTDLPAYVAAVNQKELLNITHAINLDGGSASAFHNTDTTLSELTHVGSFFCVNK